MKPTRDRRRMVARQDDREPSAIEDLRGKRLLFAASTGGHLAQLIKISDLINADRSSHWTSFDTPQSRSLLQGRAHSFVPYIAPRDKRSVARAFASFWTLLGQSSYDGVVSTGSAIALASHSAAVLRGYRPVYIESVSRFDGPSTTGRILNLMPRIVTLTQHATWASSRWRYGLSVMDAYRPDPLWSAPSKVSRIFVTLGTIKPYRFDALIDAVCGALPPGVEVIWQTGATVRDDLPGRTYGEMSADAFASAIASSDVVITHAGVGTLLQLLDLGVPTLAVSRRVARGEHVDDHQKQAARELSQRGLISVAEADELTWLDIEAAAGRRALFSKDR
jgi:UDP-N-acetylglucosamine--N-acetylmuramyl-(pentapeptide) pyrophosphoryl-undecaprenol N-acetylglucosamine transferase